MNLRSIRWQLPISYAGIALLAALALGAVLISILRSYYNGLEQRYLQGNARQIGLAVGQLLQAEAPEFIIRDQVSSWAFMLQARVQLLDMQENLLVDSGSPDVRQVLIVSNPGGPPGFDEVIAGGAGFGETVVSRAASPTGTIESWQMFISPRDQLFVTQKAISGTQTLIESCEGEECAPAVIHFKAEPPGLPIDSSAPFTSSLAVAAGPVGVVMPVENSLYGFSLGIADDAPQRRSEQIVERPLLGADGRLLGIIRLSEGPAYGEDIVANVLRGWLAAGTLAVALAALAGWWVSRRLAAPLLDLTGATARMAEGDLGARAAISTQDEIGRLGRSFNEMAERVEETVQTLKHFVSDAAHELHTPLTALRTNLELVNQGLVNQELGNQAEGVEAFLAAAQEQTLRLERLVNDLLQLSRLEANQAAHVRLDLNEIANELSEVYASRAEQQGIEFSASLPDAPLPVCGEREQLRRLLGNLLDNALKFTPSGGQIELRLALEDGWACLTVGDTGIGIPAEDLPELFQRFHRGRNAAPYPGSGLGLAIAQTIAQAHGGGIEVQSGEMGTEFVVRLPGEGNG